LISESVTIESAALGRSVKVDFYLPSSLHTPSTAALCLVNDGQDLTSMNFGQMVAPMFDENRLRPLIIAGIYCGDDRLNEYGMASSPDYKGRGTKGGLHRQLVLEELLPFIHTHFAVEKFAEYAYAGFSLGALNAFDIAWNQPEIFSRIGVFSGSLWWRSKSQKASDYNPNRDRLMHRLVKESDYHPGMKFFFECGELDETEDRNRNGVIDSIDDTFDLMKILVLKGYREGPDIKYLQLKDGRHDVATWSRALPVFLIWAWGETVPEGRITAPPQISH
jgi:enterochelin esterase-like enzyme